MNSILNPLRSVVSLLAHAWPARNLAGLALVCSLVLVACGGGGGGTQTASAAPGTGGTGVTALTSEGPVTGFGSVIVNGTRFDDSTAAISLDGYNVNASSLRLGMVVTVVGTKSDAAVSVSTVVSVKGTADSIEIWSIAQGTVSRVVSSNSFVVAGMTMVTDSATVLDNLTSVSALTTTSVVKVWGQPSTPDLSQWLVTRLELVNTVYHTASTGLVTLRNGNPAVNGIALAASPVTLKTGQLVRAAGTLISSSATSTLTVAKITVLQGAAKQYPASGEAELEGVVTRILSTTTSAPFKPTRISLGTLEVDVSQASTLPSSGAIVQGVRVEIEGTWNAGILVARRVEIKSAEQSQEVEITAPIEQFTSVSNFVVRGQRCDASGLTRVGNGSLSSLRVGVRVHLHGLKNADVVRVTELEIE